MKPIFSLLALLFIATPPLVADDGHADDALVLDADVVANLRLSFAAAEPRDFEETVFAVGRVEPRPGAVAALSSRISGRVVGLEVVPGDLVAAGAELVRVESRQAGDPPPVVALRAPIGGVVTGLAVRLGDPVEPANALLEITDLSDVDAVARVPESAAGRLRPGARARVRLAAFPDEVFDGELTRLAVAAEPASGTLAAHFRLANPDGRLRPGLRAEFAIVVASRGGVLSVPREAVQGGGVAPRHVFVKHRGLAHAFVRRSVVLGAGNDRHVEILSGVSPGEEVVARGAYSLSFAGGGGVSLKEALDAAHGHEHAADGSELTAKGAASDDHGHAHGADDHDHDEPGHEDHDHDDPDAAHPERPWRIAAGVLGLSTLGLLIAVARRRHA